VSNITTAVQVVAGFAHTCALLSNGSMRCWGDNSYGQLGNGTTIDALTPTPVPGFTNVSSIAAG
jgi:alpha-tubulin suppressor-like RCC1 family protein